MPIKAKLSDAETKVAALEAEVARLKLLFAEENAHAIRLTEKGEQLATAYRAIIHRLAATQAEVAHEKAFSLGRQKACDYLRSELDILRHQLSTLTPQGGKGSVPVGDGALVDLLTRVMEKLAMFRQLAEQLGDSGERKEAWDIERELERAIRALTVPTGSVKEGG